MKDRGEMSTNLVYSEESPSGLFRVARGRLAIAGGKGSHGYYQVRVHGKMTLVHRIVWEMHNGEIEEGYEIDHKDGCITNNRIDNLRCVTKATNTQNRKKQEGSIETGVVRREVKGYPYWTARWHVNGKYRQKYFSITKLGYVEAFKSAKAFRSAIIEALNKDGANYSERHGK